MIRNFRMLLRAVGSVALLMLFVSSAPLFAQKKISVLIVTGGHEFQHKAFYDIFNAFPEISYDTLVQPKANKLIASPKVDEYNVIVFYDMFDSISPSQQRAYINLLNKGKPMIFLHHALVSYQHWGEFVKIVGGRFHLGHSDKSKYEQGVNINVKVLDKTHEITRGIGSFEILDEVYENIEILPGVKPLLSTTHPRSMRYIAWINQYKNSQVVYIQLGHGPTAYANASYRKLIRQSIQWSAKQASSK